MDLKKCWFEALLSTCAGFGLLGIAAWLNMMAIAQWWSANWWWVVALITLITSRFWAVPLWRGYLAISDHIDTLKIRKQHYLMLAGVNAKMQEGFDTEYHNQPLGLQLKVHNPYTK